MARKVSIKTLYSLVGRFVRRTYANEPAQQRQRGQPPPVNSGPVNQGNKPRLGSQRTPNNNQNNRSGGSNQPKPSRGGRYCNPEPIFCRVCKEDHEYLYQCKNFQSLGMDDKIQLLSRLKVCHRCLRLDSRVNLTQRSKWWNEPEPNCFMEFSCDLDSCSSKGPWRAKHVLMCPEHCQNNKAKIDAFIKTLDPKIIATNA